MAPDALPAPTTRTRPRAGLSMPASTCVTSGRTSPAASAASKMERADSLRVKSGASMGRRGSVGQLLQPPSRLDQHVVGLGEAEADLGTPELLRRIEGRPGYRGHADLLDGEHGELVVIGALVFGQPVRDVRQDVVGPPRLEGSEACLLDLGEEQVAPRLIALAEIDIVGIGQVQGGDGAFLQRVRR